MSNIRMRRIEDPLDWCQWDDTGCNVGGPSCLSCRLPACVYEVDEFERRRLFNNAGNIGERRRSALKKIAMGVSVTDVAIEFNVNKRTVLRWKREANS